MNVSQSVPDPVPTAEAQRLLLLQAMGISSYYPRFRLPGALPSVACGGLPEVEAQEISTPAAPDSATRQDTVAPVAAVVAAPAVLPEAREPVRRPAVPRPAAGARPDAPKPESRSDGRQAGTGLSFQVLLLQADKGLAICNQLPSLARPALGRGEQQLLNNILTWLGCSLQPGVAQRHFSWPLPGLATADAALAGRSLQSFLAQARQETGFTRLLLLGSSSVDCLQPQLSGDELPWQTWSTHSLAELLALPALKRSAWQQLQTLHAGLR